MNEKNLEIESAITDLFTDETDIEEIENYLDENGEEYDGDIYEVAFREAVRSGNAEYVEAHIEDVDLNDEGGSSSYLAETEDEEIQELLIDHGAFRNMDEYCEGDYRFAMETVNNEILAFDESFQEEVFKAYLKFAGLTKKKLIDILETGEEDEEEEFESVSGSISDDMDEIGVEIEDGEISFCDKVGESSQYITDILDAIGIEYEFEGEDWKLQTTGVYFVK